MSEKCASTVKAVFSDLDGTLLNPEHRISEYTASVLKQLKEKDIRFIVCTGRPYPDVFATVRKCGLHPDYIITSNGARVHDGNFNLIVSHDMDPAIVEQLVQVDETPDCNGDLAADAASRDKKSFITNLYRADEWWADRTRPELQAAYDESYQCVDKGDSLKTLTAADLDQVHEAWFVGEPAPLANLDKYLKKRYGSTLRCSYSLPFLLDCVPINVTKGNALREVCQLLSLSVEEVAAFGDGMNDEPMLRTAGFPFVMSNAQDALKAAVPHAEIIGANSDDGVAKKLSALFLS